MNESIPDDHSAKNREQPRTEPDSSRDFFHRREIRSLAVITAVELANDLSTNSYQDQQHFLRLLLRLIVQLELLGQIPEGIFQAPTIESRLLQAIGRESMLRSIEDYRQSLLSEKVSPLTHKTQLQSLDCAQGCSSADMSQ